MKIEPVSGRRRWRWRPRLAGASLPDRLFAALGATAGIALAGWASGMAAGGGTLLLCAPMGAAAVLVFAVPSSPLAQPWPVIGGCTLSALVGVAASQWLGNGAVAAGAAVGGAIVLMSLLRCLHPPGGACALLAVLGGPALAARGWSLAVAPVALNALALAAVGWGFHRLSGHSYPHRPAAPPPAPRLLGEDIDAAIAAMGESFDVERADLEALLDHAERHAEARRRRPAGR